MTTAKCQLCTRYAAIGSSLCESCRDRRFEETRHGLAEFIEFASRAAGRDIVSEHHMNQFAGIARRLNKIADDVDKVREQFQYRLSARSREWEAERAELNRRIFELQDRLRSQSVGTG